MIEVIGQSLSKEMTLAQKICKVREELQILTLKSLHEKKYFNNIAFVGGTALRLLYNTSRYSEDLDFSLINTKDYDFHKLNQSISAFFKLNNIKLEAQPKTHNTIHSVFLKFTDILQQLNVSAVDNQKLSIKLEIDTNPPNGYDTEYFPFSGAHLFSVTAYDLPSMFSGKLHACYCRKYTKGRDFYDLIWYLSKKIKPNFTLLNNAVIQTEHKNLHIKENNFTEFIDVILDKTDLNKARNDVEKFLFYPQEAEMINKNTFTALLKNYNAKNQKLF